MVVIPSKNFIYKMENRYSKLSVIVSIIIILSSANVGLYSVESRVDKETYFEELDSVASPENLTVEHTGQESEEELHPVKEIYKDNLDGEIEYLRHDLERNTAYEDWYEAENEDSGNELEVALGEPEMDERDLKLKDNQTIGVLLRKTDNHPATSPSVSIELYQNDTQVTLVEKVIDETDGEVYFTFNASDLNNLSGENITIKFNGDTHTIGGDTDTIEYGAVEWEAGMLGTEDNLLKWDASPDESDVVEYKVYRSKEKDGPYDPIKLIDADGSDEYEYIDEEKGTFDDTICWYRVHAVDDQDQESEGTDEVQEPGPRPPTSPQPEDEATKVSTETELSVFVEHTEEKTVDRVTFYDASDDTVIGNVTDVNHQTRIDDVIWENLENGETYQWYVKAEEEGIGSVKSDTWEFTTVDFAVETLDAKNITTDSAKLRGEITSLGDNNHVETFFEWRRTGEDDWTSMNVSTFEEPGEFSYELRDLDSNTEYEFRAGVRPVPSGQSEDFGEIKIFSTLKPAHFEIEIVDYDEEVIEGDELVVNYSVTNTGDVKDTQDIEFYVDDQFVDTEKDIDLEGGEVHQGEFTWKAEESGGYELRITSRSDNHQEDSVSFEVISPVDAWLSTWWPFLILIAAALVGMTGGLLYKKRASEEEPVIEDVFLISKRNSILILHNTRRLQPNRDGDIIAGMFDAVQNFIQDSFQDTGDWELNKLEFGGNKIVVERGDYVYMAVVYEGGLSEEKIQKVRDVIERIENEYGEKLKDWDGEMSELEGIKEMTQDLFS